MRPGTSVLGLFYSPSEKMGLRTMLDAIERGLGIARQVRMPQASPLFYDASTEAPRGSYHDLPSAYRVHPWVYAAVKAIAMAGADVPIMAMRIRKPLRGGSVIAAAREWAGREASWPEAILRVKEVTNGEAVEDHPVLNLLRNPLPEANITEHELKQAILTYLELTGNAYVEKIYADDARKRVRGLWPKIDPRHIWVIPGTDRLISGYIYRAGARVVALRAEDIIHFAYFHPETPYYGLAPTEVLRQALIADIRAIDWNRMFFENDATPGLVLTTEKHLDPAQVDAIRERWRDRFMGVQKSHRVAVLTDGLKVAPLSPTHTDMGFLNLRGWTREEILAVYGVPPIVVGLYKDVNRASAQTMRRLFYEQCIIPRLGKLEATLNAALVPPGEPIQLYFDLGAIEALHDQVDEKAATGRLLLNQGWTLGELRKWWKLPRATGPGINTVWAPARAMPAGEVEEPEPRRARKEFAEIVERAEEPPLVGDPTDYLPPAAPEAQLKIHKKHLAKIGMEGSRWAASFLMEIGAPIPDDWETVWSWQDKIDDWVEKETASLVTQVDATTRTRIAELIKEGMEEGKGAKAIARRLRDEFEWMSKTRAETIARTEGTYAVNYGQHELYRKSGIERHRWLATLDSRVRDIHAAAHMQEVEIDKPFLVGGEALMYPGDRSLGASPGNVINCRCAEMPITSAYSPSRDISELIWWKREAWLRGLEMDVGAAYQRDLGRWFVREGERYIRYLLDRAGIE